MIIPVLIFLTGASIGSFLQLAADRTVAGGSVLRPRSSCDACHTPLAPRDLIPVVSFVALGGRCRSCSSPIGAASTRTEILTGAVFVLFFYRFFLNPVVILYALLISLLILMSLIDLQTQNVYDAHLLAAGALSGLTALFHFRHLAASIPGLLVWMILALLLRHRMGDGDKILIAILLVGLPPALQSRFLLYAIWAAAVVAIFLLLRGASRKTAIPFVPFLTTGYALALILHGGLL